MSPELTLVVDAVGASDPHDLLRSIDNSTLSSGRFELLLLVSDAADGSWRRFADRRPNVRLVPVGEPWIASAQGDYVLRLAAEQRLFPDALTRLVEFAVAHDLDAVAGREVTPAGPIDSLLLEDVVDAGRSAQQLLAGPVVLRRRTRLDLTQPDSQPSGEGDRVGAVASYPATLGTAAKAAAPVGSVTVDPPVLSWEGSALQLRLSGRLEASSPEGWRPVIVVRELTTGLSYLLPTAGACTGADTGTSWTAEGAVDLRTAAAGEPLSAGEWQVEVALLKTGASSVPAAVPGAVLPTAFVDDRVVVSSGPCLVLDVGPTRQSCQQFPSPADATVSETAAGCRLDLQLSGWHVEADRPLPAVIALDRLRLPAQVVPAAGSATLTAFISGLAGTYVLSVQLGREPLQRTGLAVVIGGDGAVTVSTAPRETPAAPPRPKSSARSPSPSGGTKPTPANGPKPKPKPKAKSKARTTSRPRQQVPATGPVARLRHAVPRSWEPQVRRLSRVPVLRATYRRLTGLRRP